MGRKQTRLSEQEAVELNCENLVGLKGGVPQPY